MAPAVDEERRGAGHSALVGAGDVFADPLGVFAPAQLVPEAVDVEAELGGVAREIARRQLALVSEQDVVHLPELALGRGGFGRFGRELRAGVDVVERQVAPT